LEISHLARERGVKNGVVQDKLFLPGPLKLKRLLAGGFFGRILSVRGEFGYWVFDGEGRQAQRPSWNYRKEEGGIILDMLCHWRYVLDNLFYHVWWDPELYPQIARASGRILGLHANDWLPRSTTSSLAAP
jgi:predicted dehydrogenase